MESRSFFNGQRCWAPPRLHGWRISFFNPNIQLTVLSSFLDLLSIYHQPELSLTLSLFSCSELDAPVVFRSSSVVPHPTLSQRHLTYQYQSFFGCFSPPLPKINWFSIVVLLTAYQCTRFIRRRPRSAKLGRTFRFSKVRPSTLSAPRVHSWIGILRRSLRREFPCGRSATSLSPSSTTLYIYTVL